MYKKDQKGVYKDLKEMFGDASKEIEVSIKNIDIIRKIIDARPVYIDAVEDEEMKIAKFVKGRLCGNRVVTADRTFMETFTPECSIGKAQIYDLMEKCESLAEFAAYICYFRRLDSTACMTFFNKKKTILLKNKEDKVISPFDLFKTYYYALSSTSEATNLEEEVKGAIERGNLSEQDWQNDVKVQRIKEIVSEFEDMRNVVSVDISCGVIYSNLKEYNKPEQILDEITYLTCLCNLSERQIVGFKHCPDTICTIKAERVKAIYRYKISSPSTSIKLNAVENIGTLRKILGGLEKVTKDISNNVLESMMTGIDMMMIMGTALSKVPDTIKLAIKNQEAKRIARSIEEKKASDALRDLGATRSNKKEE